MATVSAILGQFSKQTANANEPLQLQHQLGSPSKMRIGARKMAAGGVLRGSVSPQLSPIRWQSCALVAVVGEGERKKRVVGEGEGGA